MTLTSAQKSKLFSRFKRGESAVLLDLLEDERQTLFDYLIRMTGQVVRSIETIDEVFQTLTDSNVETLESANDFRLLLYSTARKFNGDIWNADTDKLENRGIAAPPPGLKPIHRNSNDAPIGDAFESVHLTDDASGDNETDFSEVATTGVDESVSLDSEDAPEDHAMGARETDDQGWMLPLDLSLRCLVGIEREAVILRAVADFSFEEIAEIMFSESQVVEGLFDRGMQKIDGECSGTVQAPEKALAQLRKHPEPPRSTQATVDLSVVIRGIKQRPVGLRSRVRITLMILCAFTAVLWWFRPEWFDVWYLLSVFEPVSSN